MVVRLMDVAVQAPVLLDFVRQSFRNSEPGRKDQQLDYHLQRTHLACGDRLGTDWARR